MFLSLEDLLQPKEVKRLLEIAGTISFVNGRMTNPGSNIKHNLQPQPSDPLYQESAQIVRQAIFRNLSIREFCQPEALAAPMLCKYQPGMHYGRHVDAALLNTQPALRSDVSCTVFLSDPDSYEGGELSIEIGQETVDFKGTPGAAIVYPSTFFHQVKPVKSGQRIVSITFMQSAVRDPAKREILFTLANFINREHQKIGAISRMELEFVRNNLTRMWQGN
jgi:PKHD-type hydroxylase